MHVAPAVLASPLNMEETSYGAASTSLADFKQLSLLGEGAYSAVYKVLRLADNQVYALKKVKLPSLSDKEKQNALNEVRFLASIKDQYIIDYKEAFFDDKTRCLCIITEYADRGDLFQEITKCQKEKSQIKEKDAWRYLCGMCMGLKALHDMHILHRDLKCANVFLSNDKYGTTIAKLGDFNVSKVAKRGLCMTQTGTPYYASPEVWRDLPYDSKSDMWSLGCVLYEMLALRPPFRAEDMESLYRKVLRGQYPRIPANYSKDLGEVIGALLQVNPRHRASIDQLLQMPAMCRHISGAVNAANVVSVNDLLQTIKFPKNAIDLSVCLPKPRYHLPSSFEEDANPGDLGELRNAVELMAQTLPFADGGDGGNYIHGLRPNGPAVKHAQLQASPPPPKLSRTPKPASCRSPDAPFGGDRGGIVGARSLLEEQEQEPLPDSLDVYLQRQNQSEDAQQQRSRPYRQPGGAPAMQRGQLHRNRNQRDGHAASRPPMASYTRAQYAVTSQAPQSPMPKAGASAGLRLPKIG